MNAELESKLKELSQNPDARILDIGGWFAPCRQATHMIDIMPFATMNHPGAYGFGESKIRAENYLQVDLGDLSRLPFDDKYFDFVVCRHTLEDIREPIGIAKEMVRVAKAGYVETPHRVYESTKGVERPWWCGHYHHRWLVSMEKNRVVFQFKSHNLHSSSKFNWRQFPWQKVREEFKNTWLLWENSFEVEERIIIDYPDVKKDLEAFKQAYRGKRIMRSRWAND